MIQTMLEQGYKPAAIASSLDRSRSTISREFSRNNYIAPSLPRPVGRPYLAGGYRCVRANQRARTLHLVDSLILDYLETQQIQHWLLAVNQ